MTSVALAGDGNFGGLRSFTAAGLLSESTLQHVEGLFAEEQIPESRRLFGGDLPRKPDFLDLFEALFDGILLTGVVGVAGDP